LLRLEDAWRQQDPVFGAQWRDRRQACPVPARQARKMSKINQSSIKLARKAAMNYDFALRAALANRS
jgi:hypothetical protein